MKYLYSSRKTITSRSAAFSLVELLTVIGIISVLMVAVFSGLRGGGDARKVDGAVNVGASMAYAARLDAMSQGLGSLVVIDNGPDSDTRYRRMVVFEGTGTPNNVQWEMAGNPVTLDTGVFFLEDYSNGYGTERSFDFSEAAPQDGQTGSPCIVYEFNSSGHVVNLTGTGDIRMVFGPGIMPPGTTELTFPADETAKEEMLAKRLGFLLRPNGRPVYLTEPDQMPEGGQAPAED
jgi:type II secretory pathway pseudopilin PulG